MKKERTSGSSPGAAKGEEKTNLPVVKKESKKGFTIFLVLCLLLDLYTLYVMSRTVNAFKSVVVGVVYLAVVAPRYGASVEMVSLQDLARMTFWFIMYANRFFIVEDMWTPFVIINAVFALWPSIYLIIARPKDSKDLSDDLVCACVFAVFYAVFFLFFLLFWRGIAVSESLSLHTIPPSYTALASSSSSTDPPLFVNRPLIQHNLASAILNTAHHPSSSFTTVYGRHGTGRRSLVAKMMMDEEYDALWMTINGYDERSAAKWLHHSMIAARVEETYLEKRSRFSYLVHTSGDDSLANSFENWKTDREIFKHTTKHALVVDYSLIDLTKYNNSDPLLHNEVAMLNKIASLGIKVIAICDEMVSIFNAARRGGVDVSFVKVDDLAHDEAVQFFNQIKNSNAVAASISDDEMESLFERVGTRVGDIRNYIDTIVANKDRVFAKEFGRMMEEYEMKTMMEWMHDHKMDNQFVESQFCTSSLGNNVSQLRRCHNTTSRRRTAEEFTEDCMAFENEEEQARIITALLKSPTGFRETLEDSHELLRQIKSLSQIIDIDVVTGCNGTTVVSFLPSSTIQKRLIEDGKIVDIKDCFGVKMRATKAIDWVWKGGREVILEMLGLEPQKKH